MVSGSGFRIDKLTTATKQPKPEKALSAMGAVVPCQPMVMFDRDPPPQAEQETRRDVGSSGDQADVDLLYQWNPLDDSAIGLAHRSITVLDLN